MTCRRLGWAALLACTALAPFRAQAQSCDVAAAQAEHEQAIPAGLLHAIGRVESGRADPLTRRVAPWPWTVDDSGAGRFFATKPEAVAYAMRQLANGDRSLDIGCFQVSLLHHPFAFASIEEAFDPEANARYAARFLAELRARAGNWETAVGLYHSATSSRAAPYRAAVLTSWSGAAWAANAVSAGQWVSGRVAEGAGPPRLQFGMRVQRPGAGAVVVSLLHARRMLPRVIVPVDVRGG